MLSGAARKARKIPGTKIQFHPNPAPGWHPPGMVAGSSTGAGTSTLCTREVVELYRRAIADGDDDQVNVFKSIRNQT